jgi:hypothetical protein
MHKFILTIFLLNSLPAFAQNNVNIKAGPIILIDSESHWTYKLDSLHKKLTAYNKFSESIWTTLVDLPKFGSDNYITSISRIEIMRDTVGIALGKFLGVKIIYIAYESSCCAGCGAVVYPSTGKFEFLGCD